MPEWLSWLLLESRSKIITDLPMPLGMSNEGISMAFRGTPFWIKARGVSESSTNSTPFAPASFSLPTMLLKGSRQVPCSVELNSIVTNRWPSDTRTLLAFIMNRLKRTTFPLKYALGWLNCQGSASQARQDASLLHFECTSATTTSASTRLLFLGPKLVCATGMRPSAASSGGSSNRIHVSSIGSVLETVSRVSATRSTIGGSCTAMLLRQVSPLPPHPATMRCPHVLSSVNVGNGSLASASSPFRSVTVGVVSAAIPTRSANGAASIAACENSVCLWKQGKSASSRRTTRFA
mmetsp:Transcript_35289/g.83717  ORF Transcript_35289/g.83717 Transcript_35289/m.83717 type:complete len:293 (+) Transcript_35289:259-1137(+)